MSGGTAKKLHEESVLTTLGKCLVCFYGKLCTVYGVLQSNYRIWNVYNIQEKWLGNRIRLQNSERQHVFLNQLVLRQLTEYTFRSF